MLHRFEDQSKAELAGHVHSDSEDGAYFVLGVDLSHIGDIKCHQCVHSTIVRSSQHESVAIPPVSTEFRSKGLRVKESWNAHDRPIRGPPKSLEV